MSPFSAVRQGLCAGLLRGGKVRWHLVLLLYRVVQSGELGGPLLQEGPENPGCFGGAAEITGLGAGRPTGEYSLATKRLSHLGRLLCVLGLSFQIHKIGSQCSLKPLSALSRERPGILSQAAARGRRESEDCPRAHGQQPGCAHGTTLPAREAPSSLPIPYLAPVGSQ